MALILELADDASEFRLGSLGLFDRESIQQDKGALAVGKGKQHVRPLVERVAGNGAPHIGL